MGNLQPSHPVDIDEELKSDPRWQLLSRILLTEPFRKSHRLPTLLLYLAEHSLRGHPEEMTEQRIGTAVFGKPSDYSPAEDSAVRVHMRQLRLRLHEYFAREGQDEPIVVDVPKGSYGLVFQPAHTRPVFPIEPPALELAVAPVAAEPPRTKTWLWPALFCAAVLAAILCGIGWYRTAQSRAEVEAVPWPLSAVMQNGRQTRVVVSDGASMLRLLANKEFTLDQYLSPGFLNAMTPGHMDDNLARLVKYISDSQITSFADTLMASTFVQLAGPARSNLLVCTARDLNRREIDGGNLVFVGGPTSNPWVSLFSDRLNFEVVEDGVGGKMYFRNRQPQPGEQPVYEGLRYTGSGGEDYATIALVPGSSGPGNVLILQGLREEGTEALAILLADKADRTQLERALKIDDGTRTPVYFEALVRARTVAGAPVAFSLVATRRIAP